MVTAIRLDAARPIQAVPFEPILSVQKLPSFSYDSSIAPSNAMPSLSPHRPKLAHPMLGLIKLHQKMEEQSGRCADHFSREVERDQTEIERLQKEKEKALLDHAKEMALRNSWSTYANIAQYLTSTASFILGIASISSGIATPAGILLIASGGLGLANRVMTDVGGWKAVASWFTKSEELQRKIASRIDMGGFFLSMGMGLAGGIWAVSTGALTAAAAASQNTIMNQVATIVGVAGATLRTALQFGKAQSEKKLAYLKANLIEQDTNITLSSTHLSEESKRMERLLESTYAMTRTLKQAVQLTAAAAA